MRLGRRIAPGVGRLALLCVMLVVGCAPNTFEHALAQSIARYRVADAAARDTGKAPHLRFDALLLSDLDDALASDEPALRRQAADAYRSAARLALTATHAEIERLPLEAVQRLAERAQTEPTAAALRRRFEQGAASALDQDLHQIQALPAAALRRKLRDCRNNVRPLPDDRGRLMRQLTLSWAALPTWIGVELEESKLRSKSDAKTAKRFDRVAVWRPGVPSGDDLLARFAPVIAVERPTIRAYPPSDDRIGSVRLARTGEQIEVSVDPAEPRVYAYTWEAKIHDRRSRQLVYVWWFPARPEMSKNDPAAGHIDGGMLRITLGSDGRAAIAETALNCGCGHQVFVARDLESAAREAHGGVLRGKRFAVEQRIRGKHDVIVLDTFDAPDSAARPVLYLAAGYHEVCQLAFVDPGESDALHPVQETTYQLVPYDVLDALPLGDGVGSMFGPDGLVHGAGRPEGFLLAPTGMLSAGQPRKRGTHRIRWDDFLFDDPRLLERTLRLPSEF